MVLSPDKKVFTLREEQTTFLIPLCWLADYKLAPKCERPREGRGVKEKKLLELFEKLLNSCCSSFTTMISNLILSKCPLCSDNIYLFINVGRWWICESSLHGQRSELEKERAFRRFRYVIRIEGQIWWTILYIGWCTTKIQKQCWRWVKCNCLIT